MKTLVVLGAGKIGRLVAHFLGTCGDYRVRVADADRAAAEAACDGIPNATPARAAFDDAAALDRLFAGKEDDSGAAWAVISCAPFHCNPGIAERARANGLHYLDLTEDVAVTRKVAELATGAKTAFIPQCGLAPGFITIAAARLVRSMSAIDSVKMRVGALPRFPSNRLRYNLTWSTEGLINEYLHPCEALVGGELRQLQPLEGLESLSIDGATYEAFNTSGGLGSFAATLAGRARNVDYKSMRWPGHAELIRFLVHDLRLGEHPDELKRLFERALPATDQDQVVIFVAATGVEEERFVERTFAKTIHHREIDGKSWSAIQVTTAAGVCGVVDQLADGTLPQHGFVRQEQVDADRFLANRFGRHFA